MRTKRAFALALAALVLAVALSSGQAAAYPFTIKGYVINEQGHPAQGAKISMSTPSSLGPLNLTTDQNGYYSVSVGINEPQGLGYSGEEVGVYVDGGEKEGTAFFVIPNGSASGKWLNVTLQDKPVNPIVQPTGLAAMAVIVCAMVVLGLWLFVRRKREAEANRKSDGTSPDAAKPKRKRRKP
jgi:hypothetical protein